MKKMIKGLLGAVLLAALLAGCAAKPSESEVLAALESGTLTLEDAVSKGYVTEDWVTEYKEEHSISASNKFSVNQMSAFTTKGADGKEFTFTPGETPVLFLFADPKDSDSLAGIQTAAAAYEEIRSAGGDVALVLMSQEVPPELADSPLPTIFYGDDIKNQLGSSKDMIDGNPFSASWNMRGAFITSWYRSLEMADLPQTVTDLLDAFGQDEAGAETEKDASVQEGEVG